MFVLYRLFHSFKKKSGLDAELPSDPINDASMPSATDAEKNFAVVVWWAAFGILLFFQPAAELAFRVLLVSAGALIVGALAGFLNLLVGHAVLRAAKCTGYDASILSSMEAGALGGVSVIGPIILLTALLVALASSFERHRFISIYVTLVLEIAITVAVSAAACPVGIVVVHHMQLAKGSLLDAVHAAQAGALGASILYVPLVLSAVLFMREAKAFSVRKNASAHSMHLSGSGSFLPSPVQNQGVSENQSQRRRSFDVHTAVDIMYYMLIILCIITIRLLCF
ncbi:hypothetical protein HYDPIDRAFT_108784 [Hydnomerulius pinastri MD-312]|nr:hypothetical protein HYDPIDRAFT_108784 [Hydnomerulius pinastri MD-312]